ncbi:MULTISPECIES: helix-turn-helix domain-containing protein [Nostocales]|uniref:DNA-binding protein n=3 Tax=Nostocales TaxID=1161 RepID=A0A0C1R0E4_9CYAN|nr:RodZ domain-containing protein [Tolypothrix bouteillei]KAF3884943.1 helix-turn-helix domain-containing protein [Tolypothrix bouteillei VB521301]
MKLSSKAQEEQLMEVVAHLRQVREERAIRIDELAAYTRIRPVFLQALEEGRFEELPEPVYVQGFVRHYGDAIGLDGTAIAQDFASICSPPPEASQDDRELDKKPNIYIPLAVPYILLLVAASLGLFYILNPPRPSAESVSQKKISQVTSNKTTASKVVSDPSPKVFPVAQQTPSPNPTSRVSIAPTSRTSQTGAKPTTNVSPTPTATPNAAIAPTPTISPSVGATSPVEVSIELQDESWLRVQVDGKTEFEGTLSKGERKSWTAQKELVIRSGNAGAVMVSTNNQQPTPLGSLGSVKQVKYTSEVVNGQ